MLTPTTGSPSADSDPAVGNPADSFPPAGRVEPTDESNPAVSSSGLFLPPLVTWFLLTVSNPDGGTMYLLPIEEREEEEVPLRRKRSVHRRARTEFNTS
ncbi:hypothetical protein Tco_0498333, partial [Tanacetum coccineum]